MDIYSMIIILITKEIFNGCYLCKFLILGIQSPENGTDDIVKYKKARDVIVEGLLEKGDK